jgi:mono/diheme cytochrome c family protein
MRKYLIAGLPLLSLAAGNAGLAAERSAEDIYTTTCASCHGSDGRGAPASLTGLAVKPRDFTECQRTAREPDHDWHAVIAEGGPARGWHRMMPAFGEVLSDPEQEAVLAYVRGFCADPVWPRGDLNFPRPLITEKAFVEDEVVVSGAMATDSPRNIDGKLIYEKRFLRRQMLEILVPFGVARVPDGSREAGIGDVAVALKSLLVANAQSGTALSIGAEAALPTGNQDKGFGRGVAVVEPFLAFGQALPWESFLQVQAGAEIPLKEADGVENEGFVRTALGTSFFYAKYGRTFSPTLEAVAFRELASGAATALDLAPQLQISLSRRQHVLASLGGNIPTLNREGRSPQVMCYLLWDFVDGGLFEAW